MNEIAWAIQWRQENKLEGKISYLLGRYYARSHNNDGSNTLIFRTRKNARTFIEKRFGYIKNRPNLKIEPHGWKMPRVVKINIHFKILEN